MSKLTQSPIWEYLGVPQIGSGGGHFIISIMKRQSKKGSLICSSIHKDVEGTADNVKNKTHEVSTLGEFPIR